jgi:hypothetical protein
MKRDFCCTGICLALLTHSLMAAEGPELAKADIGGCELLRRKQTIEPYFACRNFLI